MKFKKQKIKGVYLITHNPYNDKRGLFSRVLCKKLFKKIGLNVVQTNISSNKKKNTLRGFHYQVLNSSETKLVTCIQGKIYDIVLDLRKTSKTYKKWISFKLDAKKLNSIVIPKGCANAFLTLENRTIVFYHTNKYYNSNREKGIKYNDKEFEFQWPEKIKIISKKDNNLPLYKKNQKQ